MSLMGLASMKDIPSVEVGWLSIVSRPSELLIRLISAYGASRVGSCCEVEMSLGGAHNLLEDSR